MRFLYLIRHPKSSWNDPQLRDHDRPLNKRGKRDAPLMAKILRRRGVKPDLIISSSAIRAKEFAKIIAEELGYKKDKIDITEEMYMAHENEMLRLVREAGDSKRVLFLIGHNPGMTYFANNLCGENLENIPTSGIVCIEFDADKWKDIGYGKGRMISFDYPKKHLDEE